MAIVPSFAQSSLAQALAAEVGKAMRDVDASDVIRGAKKVQRAWRGYSKRKSMMPQRKRYKTGFERRVYTGVTNTTPKRQDIPPTGPAFAFGLGALTLNDFPWPESQGARIITGRKSNQILLKGIKLCRRFQYARVLGAGDVGQIEVHWAILQLKNDEDNTELTAELATDFFRNNASNDSRSSNFPTYTSGSPWNMGMNCLAINPNNKVNVLTHRKKILLPSSAESTSAGKNLWSIDEYLKVNKKFSFNTIDSGFPSKRLFEVYWCNTVTPFEFPADPTAIQFLETDSCHTTYFKDTLC